MKRLFGFLLFLIGTVPLILIYLIKTDLLALNSVTFLDFAFQTRESLIVSVIAFVILLFIGLLMIGRVGFGIMFLLIGMAGMIFPVLAKFDIITVPTGHIYQSLLKDNFYATILIGFAILAIGIFILMSGNRKEG